MAWETVEEFVEDLHDLVIAGVTRAYSYPMIQVSTAELPVKFLGFPEIEQAVETFVSGLAQTTVTIELIVLISPALHGLNQANYDESIAIMDAMQAALKANSLQLGLNRWTISVATHQMGETVFWAVAGTLTASIGVD